MVGRWWLARSVAARGLDSIRQRRFLSSSHNGTEDLLVRDFVFRSLYGPEGYFEKKTVVGTAEAPNRDDAFPSKGLDFKGMLGENEYRWKVKELYDRGGEAWLTPSELFAPWYSRAVARYVQSLVAAEGKKGLVVAELGPGNGTFAVGFLDCLKETAPELYANTRYILVEKSAKLAEVQRERAARAHACVEVENVDAVEWKGVEAEPGQACAIIGMEVLDNLPHDRVVAHRDGSLSEAFVRVRCAHDSRTPNARTDACTHTRTHVCICMFVSACMHARTRARTRALPPPPGAPLDRPPLRPNR
jgi:hypothetical protein